MALFLGNTNENRQKGVFCTDCVVPLVMDSTVMIPWLGTMVWLLPVYVHNADCACGNP